MENGNTVPEAPFDPADGLGSQRYLGDHIYDPAAFRDNLLGTVEIDFGLAASGDAVKKEDLFLPGRKDRIRNSSNRGLLGIIKFELLGISVQDNIFFHIRHNLRLDLGRSDYPLILHGLKLGCRCFGRV